MGKILVLWGVLALLIGGVACQIMHNKISWDVFFYFVPIFLGSEIGIITANKANINLMIGGFVGLIIGMVLLALFVLFAVPMMLD